MKWKFSHEMYFFGEKKQNHSIHSYFDRDDMMSLFHVLFLVIKNIG